MPSFKVILYTGTVIFGVAQAIAFYEGLGVWAGYGSWGKILALSGALILLPLSSIPMAIVGYVGATDGWGWEWWQAALFVFPNVILSWVGILSIGFTAFTFIRSINQLDKDRKYQ